MKEMNVRYQNQGNYQLPCVTTKEQNELHIGVRANRHRQYLKQHHRMRCRVVWKCQPQTQKRRKFLQRLLVLRLQTQIGI